MKYRSREELIAQILEIANGNRVRITTLIFKARIPYNLLKKYLTTMIEKGWIECNKGIVEGEEKPTYKTTEKGLYFLKLYKDLIELINPVE